MHLHQLKERLARILEKGRVLSKANEAKLRDALTNLQSVLQAVSDGEAVTEAQRAEFNAAGMILLEAELSFEQQRMAVQKALRNQDGERRYCYVREMYDTWLVYECWDSSTDTEQLYKVSYVVDAETTTVTFGTPVAVIARVVYEPIGAVQESATPTTDVVRLVEACVPLTERAVREDGTARIKVIAPGWGSSGYYPASVLERDGPTAFPVGTKMFWNHPTATESFERPERDLSDLAAVLETAATWEADNPAGPGLYADIRVKQAFTAAVDDLAADIGTSINTIGRAAPGEVDGRTGFIVEQLANDPFTSVDFVTLPGAGGQVLQLFEAARTRPAPTPDDQPLTPDDQPPTTDIQPPSPIQEARSNVDEQEAQALRESQATLQTENARLREALLLSKARDVAAAHLAGKSDLLEATKTRIADQMAARIDALPVTEGVLDEDAYRTKIDEAITIEQAYLAAVTGSGQIKDMGSAPSGSTPEVNVQEADAQLETAFKDLGLSESAAKSAVTHR